MIAVKMVVAIYTHMYFLGGTNWGPTRSRPRSYMYVPAITGRVGWRRPDMIFWEVLKNIDADREFETTYQSINLIFSTKPIATNSYFKDHKGKEQLKSKTGVGTKHTHTDIGLGTTGQATGKVRLPVIFFQFYCFNAQKKKETVKVDDSQFRWQIVPNSWMWRTFYWEAVGKRM